MCRWKMENTPELMTERLVLRRFAPGDGEAVLRILGDRQVNTFLPMFPLENQAEAERYLRETYLDFYRRPWGYRYAVALRENGRVVGYVHLSDPESLDLGYGLEQAFWHQGLAAEACRALMGRWQDAGIPYITATHDVNNPRSGAVMRKLGMTYRYSYRELWQPKDFWVTFRMYQRNLDGREERVYRGYWERYPEHFVEPLEGELL